MIAKKIADLLETRPAGLCDPCIAAAVHASLPRVRTITDAFGLTKSFTRVPSNCPGCGEQGMVIRAGGDPGKPA